MLCVDATGGREGGRGGGRGEGGEGGKERGRERRREGGREAMSEGAKQISFVSHVSMMYTSTPSPVPSSETKMKTNH